MISNYRMVFVVLHAVGTSGHSKGGYNSLILIILNTKLAFEKGLSTVRKDSITISLERV